MFKFLSKKDVTEASVKTSVTQITDSVPARKKPRLLASHNVHTREFEFYEVLVRNDATEAETKALVAELLEIRKSVYGKEAVNYPVMIRHLDWADSYFFSGMTSLHGMDYNPQADAYKGYDLIHADKILSGPKKNAVDLTVFEDVTEATFKILGRD